MSNFIETRQRLSPTGLTIVVAAHLAAVAAVVAIKGPTFIRMVDPPLQIENVPLIDPPEPIPQPQPEARSRAPVVVSQVPVAPRDPVTVTDPQDTGPTIFDPGPIGVDPPQRPADPPRIVPPPDPVRVDAEFDPRFAGSLQPPYPVYEERMEMEGTVQIRVHIGTDGRVTSADRIAASSDGFWRATERQALSRWRFRPATVDGRPVTSSKTLTVVFRLSQR